MTIANVGRFEILTDGTLPKYSSIGTYPLVYVTMESDSICADCANQHDRVDIDGQEVNWEEPSLHCAECEERIESAYAEHLVDERGE